MKINGNLLFSSTSPGELQNVSIEKLDTAPQNATAGRIYYNTTDKLYYYADGTSWQAFSTGGSATQIQADLNKLFASIGNSVVQSGENKGQWNGATAFENVPLIDSATSVTNALTILANSIDADDELAELRDVNLSSPTTGQFLKFESGKWVNKKVETTDVNGVTASADELNVLDGIPSTLTAQELGYVDGVTSNIQSQLDGKQAADDTLTSLAALTGAGLVVSTGSDTFAVRSIEGPQAGLTITNPAGTAGNPKIELANDLAALEGLSGTGYVVRTGDGQATTRTIGGQTGRIVISDGDGKNTNTDIDLAQVVQADTGAFKKVTIDSYGRVSGNVDVVASDITGLIDGTYVKIAGDAMTGNLTMNGGTVTGLPDPVNGSDAANKNYVDAKVAGLTWKNAVAAMSTSNVDVATGGLIAIDGYTVVADDRVLLRGQTTETENGIWIAKAGEWERATDADVFGELNGAAVFVNRGSAFADTGWTQTSELSSFAGQHWVQFSGSGLYADGTGLTLDGNTLNVNLGAGIFEGPSDAVGIDLYSVSAGALILTNDGSTRETPLKTDTKLHLLLKSNGGLTQDAAGLYIPTASVTNAMLASSSIGLNADSGNGNLSLGATLLVQGDASQGISTSVVGQTVTVTADDASDTQKGVASFNSNFFEVIDGSVTLVDGGLPNNGILNSFITFTASDIPGSGFNLELGETVHLGSAETHNVYSSTDIVDFVIDWADDGMSIDLSLREATTLHKGVASFSSDHFNVYNGYVSLDASIESLNNVNPYIEAANPTSGAVLTYDGDANWAPREIYYLYDSTFEGPTTIHYVRHNLGQMYVNVTVVDADDEMIIPSKIKFTSSNALEVHFTSAIDCKVVVMGVKTEDLYFGVGT
jgi:hypothetical protein